MSVVEGDERSPQGKSGDESACAVDGIEHPGERTAAGQRPVFFAEDAVRRVALADQCAHDLLARLVGDGDGVEDLAAFVGDIEL